MLALYECGHAFTDSEKGRDFEYYERLTVRDSSLSACCQSIVAAEVGHMDLAYDYFAEAALMDLEDLEHNTRDGVHIASLAGTWLVAVAGFGGMRDHFGKLTFRPRLPDSLTRLRFRLMFRGRGLQVEVDSKHARYQLRSGDPLTIEHHGDRAPGDDRRGARARDPAAAAARQADPASRQGARPPASAAATRAQPTSDAGARDLRSDPVRASWRG